MLLYKLVDRDRLGATAAAAGSVSFETTGEEKVPSRDASDAWDIFQLVLVASVFSGLTSHNYFY